MSDALTTVGLAVFLYMNVWFLLALLLKDNSIVNVAWGGAFILIALITYPWGQNLLRPFIVTLLVIIWAGRLSLHILLRRRGKGEDFRYAAWRREWGRWVVPRSFFQIFMLQGAIALVVASGVIVINLRSGPWLTWLDLLGVLLWAKGFFFQAVGDMQLQWFKSDPANRGRIMTRGLWKYTRHPNYFGEVLMWWGIYIIALGAPGGWITIIAPLTITLLLLKVSGVPMLEQGMAGRPGWDDYARRTSPFLPWWPRRT